MTEIAILRLHIGDGIGPSVTIFTIISLAVFGVHIGNTMTTTAKTGEFLVNTGGGMTIVTTIPNTRMLPGIDGEELIVIQCHNILPIGRTVTQGAVSLRRESGMTGHGNIKITGMTIGAGQVDAVIPVTMTRFTTQATMGAHQWKQRFHMPIRPVTHIPGVVPVTLLAIHAIATAMDIGMTARASRGSTLKIVDRLHIIAQMTANAVGLSVGARENEVCL